MHIEKCVILKRGRFLALIMTQRHSLLGRSWTIVFAYYTLIWLIQRAKMSASALMSHFLSLQSGFARCFRLLQSSPFLLDWRRIIWGTYPLMSRCNSLHFSRRKLSSGHLAIYRENASYVRCKIKQMYFDNIQKAIREVKKDFVCSRISS
jgi:hypothetical protein